MGDAARRSQASWGPARRLKQVSGHGQAPLGRPAGTSCTSQYFCLRFHILLSQALPRGSPHGHVCSGTRAGQAQASRRHGTTCLGTGCCWGPRCRQLAPQWGLSRSHPRPEPIAQHWEGRLPVAEGFQALHSCCSCSGRSLGGAHWPQAAVRSDLFTPVAFGTAVPIACTSEEEMPEGRK